MVANMFSEKNKIVQVEKDIPMDEALISLPENESLKFLMPSRRHHPQVEPLLATYKILLYQKVAKTFWSLQETVLLQKMLSLEAS